MKSYLQYATQITYPTGEEAFIYLDKDETNKFFIYIYEEDVYLNSKSKKVKEKTFFSTLDKALKILGNYLGIDFIKNTWKILPHVNRFLINNADFIRVGNFWEIHLHLEGKDKTLTRIDFDRLFNFIEKIEKNEKIE